MNTPLLTSPSQPNTLWTGYHPGYANRAARAQLRPSEVLLEIVSHWATGAKHFMAEASHRRSVSHADTVDVSMYPIPRHLALTEYFS